MGSQNTKDLCNETIMLDKFIVPKRPETRIYNGSNSSDFYGTFKKVTTKLLEYLEKYPDEYFPPV